MDLIEPTYAYHAKIKRTIDGDTVVVDWDLGRSVWIHNEHIRLYGINTPELNSKIEEERIKALSAKNYLESLLPAGTAVVMHTIKDSGDKYGRILGKFYVKKENLWLYVNEEMIANGHAVLYTP